MLDLLPLIESLGHVRIGKHAQVQLAVICVLAAGHLLIEDSPGMGKSMLAEATASAFCLAFKRVSFNSDLLPADLIGINMFDYATTEFRFLPGSIFNQVFLADQINRASPHTQSALLEAIAAVGGREWHQPPLASSVCCYRDPEQPGSGGHQPFA